MTGHETESASSSASALTRRFGLNGKVAIVCDVANSIGLAMADAFADAGASIVVVSEEAKRSTEVAAALHKRGVPALGLAIETMAPEEIQSLYSTALEHFGRIDALASHIGVAGPVAPMAEIDDETWDLLFEINLRAPFRMSNLVAPILADQGGGSIIVTSSIAGLRGNASIGVYGMAKAALMQFARNLAVEWGPQGVRANALAPAFTNANWAGQVLHDSDASTRRRAQIPLRRIAVPAEIAGTAAFLAGPSAAAINGQTIVIDGGTTISDGT